MTDVSSPSKAFTEGPEKVDPGWSRTSSLLPIWVAARGYLSITRTADEALAPESIWAHTWYICGVSVGVSAHSLTRNHLNLSPTVSMSKLSESLKALISAAHARPGTVRAPSNIRAVYTGIADDAAAKSVGLPAWLTISVSDTYLFCNHMLLFQDWHSCLRPLQQWRWTHRNHY